MTEKELEEKAGLKSVEYVGKHYRKNISATSAELGFKDGFILGHESRDKEIESLRAQTQVMREALEMAKFSMNAFITKVPVDDLVTRDLMQIEVERYDKALKKSEEVGG